MAIDKPSTEVLSEFFDDETFFRGVDYFQKGRAERIRLSGFSADGEIFMEGWVAGSRSKPC